MWWYGNWSQFLSPKDSSTKWGCREKESIPHQEGKGNADESQTSQVFWDDAMSTTCYISNRAYLRKKLDKTPYELYKERKSNLTHLHIFGCKCFLHNNGKENFNRAKATGGFSWHKRAKATKDGQFVMLVSSSVGSNESDVNVGPHVVLVSFSITSVWTSVCGRSKLRWICYIKF